MNDCSPILDASLAIIGKQARAGRSVSVADIQIIVAAFYNLTTAELLGPSRKHRECRPRQMAMQISRSVTRQSLPDIGRRFGGRDHTTVICACKSVAKRYKNDPSFKAEYDSIWLSLRPITRAEYVRSETVRGVFVSRRRRAV